MPHKVDVHIGFHKCPSIYITTKYVAESVAKPFLSNNHYTNSIAKYTSESVAESQSSW